MSQFLPLPERRQRRWRSEVDPTVTALERHRSKQERRACALSAGISARGRRLPCGRALCIGRWQTCGKASRTGSKPSQSGLFGETEPVAYIHLCFCHDREEVSHKGLARGLMAARTALGAQPASWRPGERVRPESEGGRPCPAGRQGEGLLLSLPIHVSISSKNTLPDTPRGTADPPSGDPMTVR